MRFVRLLWITTTPGRAWVGSVSNKHNPSTKSGLGACISSRITTVIHVMNDHQINYNCFNEPFAVSPYRSLYWDMHGLIFETSIWLLAGSTRFCFRTSPWTRYMFMSGRQPKLRNVRTYCRLAASVLHKYSTCEHKSVYTQHTCIYNVGCVRYV